MGKIEVFALPIEPLSQSPRKIWVYLPDSYSKSTKIYPVLYMFDGHNLFYDKTSTYGKCWGIKKYLDRQKLDIVVIGQDCNHTDNIRLDEYCPFTSEKSYMGISIRATGQITGKWFTEILIPYCQAHYRIHSDRQHTGIAGSSMGGIMAEFMVSEYNHIFSKAGCVSPAHIFNYHVMCNHIENTLFKDTRIYLDLGSEEERSKKALVKELSMLLHINHLFTKQGCTTYPNLVVNGTHSEESWEKVFPTMLNFLFPELYENR